MVIYCVFFLNGDFTEYNNAPGSVSFGVKVRSHGAAAAAAKKMDCIGSNRLVHTVRQGQWLQQWQCK